MRFSGRSRRAGCRTSSAFERVRGDNAASARLSWPLWRLAELERYSQEMRCAMLDQTVLQGLNRRLGGSEAVLELGKGPTRCEQMRMVIWPSAWNL